MDHLRRAGRLDRGCHHRLRKGLLTNIVVGVIGAFLGGWLFNQFGGLGVTGFNLYSLLVAVVGAIVLLVIVRLFSRGG